MTPKIAEKIAVAQTVGALSLSLRSIADNAGDLEEAIASGDVNVPEDDPKAEKAMLARIAAAPQEGNGDASTGADVSRFQRSTVPGKPVDDRRSRRPHGCRRAPGAAPVAPIGPIVRVARGNQ